MAFIQFPSQLIQEQEVKLLDTGNGMEIGRHAHIILDKDISINNAYYLLNLLNGAGRTFRDKGDTGFRYASSFPLGTGIHLQDRQRHKTQGAIRQRSRRKHGAISPLDLQRQELSLLIPVHLDALDVINQLTEPVHSLAIDARFVGFGSIRPWRKRQMIQRGGKMSAVGVQMCRRIPWIGFPQNGRFELQELPGFHFAPCAQGRWTLGGVGD